MLMQETERMGIAETGVVDRGMKATERVDIGFAGNLERVTVRLARRE
jgi:hypothetical protein